MPVFPQSMSDFKPGETNIKSGIGVMCSYSGYRCVQIGMVRRAAYRVLFFQTSPGFAMFFIKQIRFFKWKQAKHPVGCEEMKTPAN